MLIQFNFKNYKSFRDEASLDMTATSVREHPYNLIEANFGDRLLKTVSIYGANASGKSNIVEAFAFMQFFISQSLNLQENKEKYIPLSRFLFDEKSKQETSEFEVFFINNNVEYQYGFVIDNKKIYEEWLYARYAESKDYEVLFERADGNIKCGRKFKKAQQLIELVEDATLFLTLTSKTKVQEAKDVFKWIMETKVLSFGNAFLESIISTFIPFEKLKSDDYRKKCEAFLSAIDTGIIGIRIEKSKDNVDEESVDSYEVYTKHISTDGKTIVEIPLNQESSGTQKMFHLFNLLTNTLEHGKALFVDELDAKLHPLLLRYIISMFHNTEINRNNAQLIYTTHDNYTLTKDIFRRDQIWFVQKNDVGISNLYSLAEYKIDDKKVRNDATYAKDYLLGRYGAIPLFKEFNIMGD